MGLVQYDRCCRRYLFITTAGYVGLTKQKGGRSMANKHRSASALIGAHNALLLQLLLVLQKKEVLGGDEVDAIFAQARQQLEGRPATVQDLRLLLTAQT